MTALSVLGFSDLRMPLSPGSLQNETLGVQEVCLHSGICSMFDRWGDAASGELGLCRGAQPGTHAFLPPEKSTKFPGFLNHVNVYLS